MDVLWLFLAAGATALATGLGAVPVFFLGSKAEMLRPILLGGAIGAMTVASLAGLLRPALQEGGRLSVAGGLTAGDGRIPEVEPVLGGCPDERAPAGGRGRRLPSRREDRGPASLFVRLRGRRDADSRRRRAGAAGLYALALGRRRRRHARGSGSHARSRCRPPGLTSNARRGSSGLACGNPAEARRAPTDGGESASIETPFDGHFRKRSRNA